jgi:hypothetical protein
LDQNGLKLAGLIASLTLHAFGFIELMGFLLLPKNCVNRTDLETGSTARARFRIDRKRDEPFAGLRWTLIVFDVGFIFFSKMLKR